MIIGHFEKDGEHYCCNLSLGIIASGSTKEAAIESFKTTLSLILELCSRGELGKFMAEKAKITT